MTGENGLIGVMTHELTFNELVVESQHLLKLQSIKITKKYPVLSQLNALVRCHVVESSKGGKCVWRPGSDRTRWGSFSAPPDLLAAIGAAVLVLRGGRQQQQRPFNGL